MQDTPIGTIEWHDLTVADAEPLSHFYEAVVGWQISGASMGDYEDFNLHSPGASSPVAGICHARGVNKDIPPQWLMYVRVANLSASIDAAEAQGGTLLVGPNRMGEEALCVIQDPAGAVIGLVGPQ